MMENLNAEQLQATPEVTIEKISQTILEAMASLINVGPNGEAPLYDINQHTPAPLFIGAMSAICDAFVQLHSTEEHPMDYIRAMADIQNIFTHYIVDKNIDHALQTQMAQLTQGEVMQTHDMNA